MFEFRKQQLIESTNNNKKNSLRLTHEPFTLHKGPDHPVRVYFDCILSCVIHGYPPNKLIYLNYSFEINHSNVSRMSRKTNQAVFVLC